MKKINKVIVLAKDLRSRLRLSPMHNLFRRLNSHGVDPKTFNALEVFGSNGQNHTKDIDSVVARLEIWEIRPETEPVLKQRFPQSEIKITDSYAEIKKVSKKYG